MSRTLITTFAAVAIATAASAALAGDRTASSPEANPTGQAIQRNLQDLGYRVSHVESERGRIEMRVINDANIPAKLTYDAKTGELLRAALR